MQRLLRLWSGNRYSSYEFGTVLKSSDRLVVLGAGDLRIISRDYHDLGKEIFSNAATTHNAHGACKRNSGM